MIIIGTIAIAASIVGIKVPIAKPTADPRRLVSERAA